jgi:hypothetical protein
MVNLIESGLLPITAVAAVVLFGAKEIIEGRRRNKVARLKLAALKDLLTLECERNKWALDWILKTCRDIEHAIENKVSIFVPVSYSGIRRLAFRHESGISSSPFPEAHDGFMREHLSEAASLDRDIFQQMTNSIGAVEEIRHLILGLEEHVFTDQEHLVGWIEYARNEAERIETELCKLYHACSGAIEIPPRIRPFVD